MELAKVCPVCGARYDAAAAFCQKDGSNLRLTEEQQEQDPRIGQMLLDQFRIEECIGQGGMGSVYRARQTTLGRDVAIKILHPDLASNPDAVRRFHREARISTALDHPNVVRVFLFGQLPDGSLYLVMELLRGRTLADLIRAEPKLPVGRALHIAIQICEGVGEAHSQGIVHRDVKPENVILVPKGRDPDFAKVLDFGIARLFRNEDQTQATQSGLVFGTARYISPEGAAGEKTDARSDVYSIGILTYQLLAGDTPFPASQPVTLLMQHIHDRPPHLKMRAPDVPDAIVDVVMRSLQKSPDGRYEDASDLGEALRLCADREGIDTRPARGQGTGQHAHDRRDGSTSVRREASQSVRHEPPPDDRESRPRLSVGTTDALSVVGMPRMRSRGRSPWLAAGAFVVGAAAVGGIAFAVQALRGPGDEELHAAAVARAEAALSAHHFDGPGDDDLRSITDAMLAARADDADARALRLRAADLLVQEGREEHGHGHDDVARERYELARALVPGHEAATLAIAEITPAPVAARVAEVRVEPSPVSGEPVTLTAVTADGVTVAAGDRPRFVIRHDGRRMGRRIDATAASAPGTFTATYTFPTSGSYVVEFHAGDAPGCFEVSRELDVARGARSGGGGDGDPPVTTMGAVAEPTGPSVVDIPPPVIREVPPDPPSPTLTASPPPDPPASDPPSRPSLPPAWTSGGT